MIFDRLAKTAVKKKIEKTVDDNWDAILSMFGLAAGIGMCIIGRKEEKRRDIPSSISITTNYNYYDQRRIKK